MRILKSIKNIKANKFSHKDIDCKRCKPRIVGRPGYSIGGIIDAPPTSLRKCSECGEHDNFFIYRNALINQITGQVEHVCNLENNEEDIGYCGACGKETKAIPVDAQDLI